MTLWRWLVSLLVWMSADPDFAVDEQPRSAAAVAYAYASLGSDKPIPPRPDLSKCVCGGTCVNGTWKPDGRIEQKCPCPDSCECKKGK